jgi:RecB family exonuclease
MTGEGAPLAGLHVSGRFAELEDALCERVLELRRGRPLIPLTIVVGSAAVRTHVGDLLVRRLGAVANVTVVTLARLANDLVARAEGAPPPTLAGLARERFLRRLVRDHADHLEYLGTVRERPHFAQALAATFADLREARVEPEAPWAEALVSVAGPQADRVRAKTADLGRLYRAYCQLLDARGLRDEAAVLASAARAAAGESPGKAVVYGIYDLNQAQEAFVGALISAGADVFEPLPRGAGRLNEALPDLARAAGLLERRLATPTASSDLDRVAAVWRDGAASTGESLGLAGDRSLAIASVADERAESREAVRAVIAAAQQGAPLWDCAVVAPHADDVERMAAALGAAGLPIACRRPDRSSGPRLLLRLADCLAPPAGEPFARRAVVDLMATAPLRHIETRPSEVALWLDEARQAGVVSGLSQWTERLRRRRRGHETRLAALRSAADRPEADAADDGAIDELQTVTLRLASARSLEAALDALARACAPLPARASWAGWAEALATILGTLFESPASDAARDAAERLHGLGVVDEEVDVAEAATAARELVAGARVQAGRVGRDGVAVLTPVEMRGLSFSTVVFTGLAEGGFPARGRSDPLLGDAERQRVAKACHARLPLTEQRAAEELILFAFSCEAARDRLHLLVPHSDAATGRPRLPSRLVLRLASLAAARPVGLESFLGGKSLAPVWRRYSGAVAASADDTVWVDERERDAAALLGLSRSGDHAAAREYLSAVLADPADVARRLGAWGASRGSEPGAWDGLLGHQAQRALAARHPFATEMHPTRLERYIDCPFAFLLRDVLGLEVPDEPNDTLEMDNREYGLLAHDILHRAYERVITDDLDLGGALEAVVEAWESCCAEAERSGVTGAALSWRVKREMLREDLLETVRRDPAFAGSGLRPIGLEWRFGESQGRPVVLELDDGRNVRFAGRLDRIDATTSRACVIDYKTGAGTTEKSRIKDRLSVQLPVYQLAVRQSGDQSYAVITSLYRSITRRGGFDDQPLPQDEASAAARLRGLVGHAVELVDAGMFPRTTRGRCDYCDLGYACGFSAWARARKRQHAALERVRDLQGPLTGDDDVS